MKHHDTPHSEANLRPQDYQIIDYFDNQPPRAYFGMKSEHYEALLAIWRKERAFLFPENNDHRCEHCGQTRVRYVVSVLHIPTGKKVCFGDVCVDRLHFPNHDALKAALIRKRAETAARSLRVSEAIYRALESDPALKDAVERVMASREDENNPHYKNHFAHDVLNKFKQYGNLSQKQRDAFVRSVAKDLEWETRRKARAAEVKPALQEGRRTIEGTGTPEPTQL